MQSDEWGKSVFTFYTFEGAKALRDKLRDWKGGKAGSTHHRNADQMPRSSTGICFLADSFFKDKRCVTK
jgi:sulfide:quinone oxidoreductase